MPYRPQEPEYNGGYPPQSSGLGLKNESRRWAAFGNAGNLRMPRSLHSSPYSVLSASSGSSLAARSAGMTPAIRPISTDRKNADSR